MYLLVQNKFFLSSYYFDFEAITWNARASSIGQERQFDSQSIVKQAVLYSEAITFSNIKNIKFESRNNKLD